MPSQTLLSSSNLPPFSVHMSSIVESKPDFVPEISSATNPFCPELFNDKVDSAPHRRTPRLPLAVAHLALPRRRTPYQHSNQWLQISEWMNQKWIRIFLPVEHAVELDLIGKVREIVSAEEYFNNLRDKDRTSRRI